MSKIQDNIHKTKPRSRCFLGCFGFSERKSGDMVKSHSRKNPRWFSWSRFGMKKSAAKTVPVDTSTVPEKVNRRKDIPAVKSNKRIAQKHQIPAAVVTSSQIPTALPDQQRVHEKSQKATDETGQGTILESRKSLDSVKDDTGQKRLSFCRKTETTSRTVCHPVSPKNKPKHVQTAPVLSQSASFPPPQRKKQGANVGGNSHVSHRESSDTLAGKFDPVVGMSIIMVTLIIMLLWGRLCAILFTSAWFYFIPRFKTNATVESNATVKDECNSGDSDVNSGEHKKKVVLEGFLERNHRFNGLGIL
ncbi:hypothetical protein F0562_033590 [Nyssa sinensis]|uniref:Uncharacterized protein n=1 Tax=Nyssa sinensis TaxID=561372 RepID=A0A5J5AGD9_9ASTE|nr:hypothetical protein F0562_033590 [Nyssa sinensis]